MTGFPHGFTVAVSRPPGTDRYGNPLPADPPHDIEGCAGAPAGSYELLNGQVTVLTQDTVYASYDADIASQDELTIPEGTPLPAGVRQVDGRPLRWKNPWTGREFGTVIRLTSATG